MEPEQQRYDEERPPEGGESPAAGIEPDEAVPDDPTGVEPPEPPDPDHVVEEKGQE